MSQNKNLILYSLLFILLGGCIEPYDLKDLTNNIGKLVINGEISNMAGEHTITVSQTSSVEDPTFIGVSNCEVFVIDENNTTFYYRETYPGIYHTYLNEDDIQSGVQYKLIVITPSEERFESEWDLVEKSAPLSAAYGERKDIEHPNGDVEPAVQFYTNFKGLMDESRYYRFDMQETYEFRNPYTIDYIYAGGYFRSDIGDMYQVCYRTLDVKQIYTLATTELTVNEFIKYPLVQVGLYSEKLNHKYSLLLTQMAISKSSYYFWKAIEANSQESGGLYDKQPISIQGNIYSTQNKEEKVLGNFGVAIKNQGRYFFHHNEFGMTKYQKDLCESYVDPDIGMTPPEAWPIYVVETGGQYEVASKSCFDCRLIGGTIEKPDFW